MQILPFILLGIGVDDIFVLVRSVEEVDEQHPNLPLPERFRKALNLGGMSITVTSVTNATAFMVGSLTAIPAVRWCAALQLSSSMCILFQHVETFLDVFRQQLHLTVSERNSSAHYCTSIPECLCTYRLGAVNTDPVDLCGGVFALSRVPEWCFMFRSLLSGMFL